MAKRPSQLPWMRFFVDDYIADESLGMCSLAAQGLWVRLLCIMHKSHRRGFLCQANGEPLSLEQTARLAGCSTEEAGRLVQELLHSGAASAERGVLYSRRMLREADISRKRSISGRLGGNPALKQKLKGQGKEKHGLSPLDSGSSDLGGGLGEPERPAPIGRNGFPATAAGCAQAWCGVSRRLKGGYPEDEPADVEAKMGELLRHGFTAAELLDEIFRADRKLSEYFWQFEARIERNRNHESGRPGQRVGPSSRVRAPKGKYDGVEKVLDVDSPAADESGAGEVGGQSAADAAHGQKPGAHSRGPAA